jgi:membrane protein implicated in regulation of membrane protease activity
MMEECSMWLWWLIIIVILAIIEFSTVNLTTIWFITSGLVSLLISFITDNFYIQFGVFVILGVILLITTRPFLVKWLTPIREKTNLDRVVGMEGIVTEDILPNRIGEVKVDGKKWSAKSEKKLKVDEIVIVEKIEGVKLIVRKKES